MILAVGWWESHWSEVAAVTLVIAFMALIASGLRASLALGQVNGSRRLRRSTHADPPPKHSMELVRLEELDQRLRELERRFDSPPAGAPARDRPLREQILKLAASGVPPREIAAALDEPLGRVELVLNLNRALQLQ